MGAKIAMKCAVYPRVCGGTAGIASWVPIKKGLSPRVRGNRVRSDREAVPVRSIPACAGEPRSGSSGHSSLKVYPRVCGGTSAGVKRGRGMPGLSPRVRGNRRGGSW